MPRIYCAVEKTRDEATKAVAQALGVYVCLHTQRFAEIYLCGKEAQESIHTKLLTEVRFAEWDPSDISILPYAFPGFPNVSLVAVREWPGTQLPQPSWLVLGPIPLPIHHIPKPLYSTSLLPGVTREGKLSLCCPILFQDNILLLKNSNNSVEGPRAGFTQSFFPQPVIMAFSVPKPVILIRREKWVTTHRRPSH